MPYAWREEPVHTEGCLYVDSVENSQPCKAWYNASSFVHKDKKIYFKNGNEYIETPYKTPKDRPLRLRSYNRY
jgi:hypothetical protein